MHRFALLALAALLFGWTWRHAFNPDLGAGHAR